MGKNYILNHIEDLSADQLAREVTQGNITLEELQNTGNLDATKRNKIKSLIKGKDDADNKAYESAKDKGDVCALQDYITNFPYGLHINEAKQAIDRIRNEKAAVNAQKAEITNKIKRNPNSYSPTEIQSYLANCTLTRDDLFNCGIPQSAIDNLDKIVAPRLVLGETPSDIPQGYTEVYFWGGTGSGKTCALGAVLRVAEERGYLRIATGPGYQYALQLKNIFSDDNMANDFLPPPTPVENNQYLPFSLKNPKEKNSRSVSLIELSGEIFKCFFNKNARIPFPTQSHADTFNSLSSFLKSDNRKLHFFFVDYDRENKPDAQGLTQSDYLNAAATYFMNNKVFDKTTDAIYVVVTKSDLFIDKNGNAIIGDDEKVKYALEYLKQENYISFLNSLKDNCKRYSINGGILKVRPFSLGKVYFKQICNFDGSEASRIVDILMERIKCSKKSILDVFNK